MGNELAVSVQTLETLSTHYHAVSFSVFLKNSGNEIEWE